MKNLSRNMSELLSNSYVIPLYQRNFAWGEEEIVKLLQDVYESFKYNPRGNYFIGSLVVLKRRNDSFEVIDGQQRLTVLTLLSKILNISSEPKLSYDSRPEIEAFLALFYSNGVDKIQPSDSHVECLMNAISSIKNANLDANSEQEIRLSSLSTSEFASFRNFFAEHVILVHVEIPSDTDVASYFEIMNNRGEQLQKHEILKALMMNEIAGKPKRDLFAKIWEACSQMDVPVQKMFSAQRTDHEERILLFGENYDELHLHRLDDLKSLEKDEDAQCYDTDFSIDSILSTEEKGIKSSENRLNTKYTSIIDFPNFLMHILRLYAKKKEIDAEIRLNERYLLDDYQQIETRVDKWEFAKELLRYRVLFDRYIIKTTEDEEQEDQIRWVLIKPAKSEGLFYKNTFKDDTQEMIVKALSMLQVTFRTRTYKNWLQSILAWLGEKTFQEITSKEYLKALNDWSLTYFDDKFIPESDVIAADEWEFKSKGTKTPHFLFNFIDYLYWVESKNQTHGIANIKSVMDFDFKYRNSVEHHLPQSERNEDNEKEIDNLGNLFLVNKSLNSRMNNENPLGKAAKNGKYYNDKLAPNRKIVYELTNERNLWDKEAIKKHYEEIVILLEKRKQLLEI